MTDSAPTKGSDTQKGKTSSEGMWGSIQKWFKENRSQVLLFLGGLALYFLLGLFLWWLLQLYVNPSAIENDAKEATAKKDLLQALGFIMAGVAGAIGIYFTWRGQRITQESLQDTRENTEENLRLTRQGQITDRFTSAIDQLGATADDRTPRLEIRLGGIYALERIARDSPERDYSTVMEVLTAYVRENSRRDHEKPSTPTTASNEDAEQDKGDAQGAEPPVRRPPTDIQAILDVLNGLEEDHVSDQHRVGLDLRGAFLQGAKLQGALLQGATLQEAFLQGAFLREVETGTLDQEQINLAYGDERTKLPKGLHAPPGWRSGTDDQLHGDE